MNIVVIMDGPELDTFDVPVQPASVSLPHTVEVGDVCR